MEKQNRRNYAVRTVNSKQALLLYDRLWLSSPTDKSALSSCKLIIGRLSITRLTLDLEIQYERVLKNQNEMLNICRIVKHRGRYNGGQKSFYSTDLKQKHCHAPEWCERKAFIPSLGGRRLESWQPSVARSPIKQNCYSITLSTLSIRVTLINHKCRRLHKRADLSVCGLLVAWAAVQKYVFAWFQSMF